MTADSYALFTDGGARGNPGPAAIGGLLTDPAGKTIDAFSIYLGLGTNNQAEYRALLYGLTLAQKHAVTHIICYLDSELVVRQMNREYTVKDAVLSELFAHVYALTGTFQKLKFVHIPREKNSRADALVNRALDHHH